MATKKKNTAGVTPVGEAFFCHVLKTESFKEKDTGRFTIMLKLSEKDTMALLGKISAEWEKYKDTLTGKKFKCEPSFGMKEYKDEEYFKFSMKETIVLKTGEELHRTVPIYDCECKEISKSLAGIGNGSKVKVAYELSPFYMNDKNFGISLRLVGVQIIEYVAYGGQSAESLGFGKTEGFKADDLEATEELPFDTDENSGEDNVEGDF